MDPIPLEEYLNFAKTVAVLAGDAFYEKLGFVEEVISKGEPTNLVTEADQLSESIVIKKIKDKFPDHSIISEELGYSKSVSTKQELSVVEIKQFLSENEWVWIVDPLDGTTNFAHTFPVFGVSIALVYKQEPVIGVIYDPSRKELFAAAKGLGTTLNERKIQVSGSSKLIESLLATGFAYDRVENLDNNYKEFCHMTSASRGVRRLGAAAIDLAYVAAGRLDGFWEHGLNIWDVAAGILLIKEAKGRVSDYLGGVCEMASGRVLASNGKIHELMIEALSQAKQFKFMGDR